MTVVDHYCDILAQNLRIAVLVELCGNHRQLSEDDSHRVHRLETQVHEFWLFVLHGKNNDEHDVLEVLLIHAE